MFSNYYFKILLLSILLGLFRWFLLDASYPLIPGEKVEREEVIYYEISDVQPLQCSSEDGCEITNPKQMKEYVLSNKYLIIDARDSDSYKEGHIGNAINIDKESLYSGDDEYIIKTIEGILSSYGYIDNELENNIVLDINNDNSPIIVYCWNPKCRLAENVIDMLIDKDYYGQFGYYFSKKDFFIYKGGWDEWIKESQ
jgi:rhodanese-related sulfurtransferase